MIPYVTLPPLMIGSLLVQPFALLVSIGVLVAHFLLLSRAHRMGLLRPWAGELSVVMVICGFAGAVLFKPLYRPDLLAEAGWGAWRNLPGISSFGGLFGALGAAWIYLALVRRVGAPDRLRYLDAVGFAFPFGFVFGRLGCTLTHDHPGLRATAASWFTVAYPDGARYDLGLVELLYLLVLCAVLLRLDRRPRRSGFFITAMLLTYGLFRVALDRLHVDPPRYASLSVDQWSGLAVALLGLVFAWRFRPARPL